MNKIERDDELDRIALAQSVLNEKDKDKEVKKEMDKIAPGFEWTLNQTSDGLEMAKVQAPPDKLNLDGYFPNGLAPSEKTDLVNHPAHYELDGMECIDVIFKTQGKQATIDFCICNALKYLYRWRMKNGVEDVKKAKWYIDKFLELEG